jgi:hypothetical protein
MLVMVRRSAPLALILPLTCCAPLAVFRMMHWLRIAADYVPPQHVLRLLALLANKVRTVFMMHADTA